jgi:hypothetical protein
MIDLIIAPRPVSRLANSARPDAPVVRVAAPAPPRSRSAVAALLRRVADRLAPDPDGLPAQ